VLSKGCPSAVFASTATGLRRWAVSDIVGREEPPPPHLHGNGQMPVAGISDDGRTIVFGTSDKKLWVGDPAKYPDAFPLPGSNSRTPHYLAVSPDGAWAASTNRYDKDFKVWNLRTRTPPAEIPRQQMQVEVGRPAFTADSQFLIVTESLGSRWFRVGNWDNQFER
jgi:hypothetical protein